MPASGECLDRDNDRSRQMNTAARDVDESRPVASAPLERASGCGTGPIRGLSRKSRVSMSVERVILKSRGHRFCGRGHRGWGTDAFCAAISARHSQQAGVGDVTQCGETSLMKAVVVSFAASLIAIGLGGTVGAAADDVSVTIATGRVGGLYHPVGGAICKLVNENRDEHGIDCTVEISGGSIPNIRDLREGDVDLALAQSDELHNAYYGNGPFREDGAFKDLRLAFGLYIEHFTVVALGGRDMDTFEDLKGKRVYAGGEDSSRRHALDVLMDAHGWTGDEVTDVSTFKASNLAEALCDDEFDAFVYTIGHPNPTVREAAILCDINLLDVSPDITEKLARQNPFYVSSVIKGGTYRGNPQDTPTLGVPSMLATSAEVDEDVIYQVTKAYFESLDLLQALSPLFLSFTKDQMDETDLDVPFHEGALKYFAEAGLD